MDKMKMIEGDKALTNVYSNLVDPWLVSRYTSQSLNENQISIIAGFHMAFVSATHNYQNKCYFQPKKKIEYTYQIAITSEEWDWVRRERNLKFCLYVLLKFLKKYTWLSNTLIILKEHLVKCSQVKYPFNP